MNKFFCVSLFFLCLQANASYECEATFFNKTKIDKSTIKLIQDNKNKNLFTAERNGYVFEIKQNETNPKLIEKVSLTEKATSRKALSFGEIKGDDIGKPFGAGLVEGPEGGERIGARIICKITSSL